MRKITLQKNPRKSFYFRKNDTTKSVILLHFTSVIINL